MLESLSMISAACCGRMLALETRGRSGECRCWCLGVIELRLCAAELFRRIGNCATTLPRSHEFLLGRPEDGNRYHYVEMPAAVTGDGMTKIACKIYEPLNSPNSPFISSHSLINSISTHFSSLEYVRLCARGRTGGFGHLKQNSSAASFSNLWFLLHKERLPTT